MVMKPKPTGSATQKKKIQEMLKKKKKDALKNKIKEKLKNKKKTKSTKTGLLSKAGLMPVSTPGGIPKVISQKTAQKDPKPKRPKRRPQDLPGIRPPERMPPILRPQNPPKKFTPAFMKRGGSANKSLMDLARKIKPTGRLSTTDLERAKAAILKAMKEDREKLKMRLKGQKPVFITGTKKKVKGLTQKAGQGKPLTAAQKKKLQGMMGMAGKGMRKAFGGKNMRSAAKKLRRIM